MGDQNDAERGDGGEVGEQQEKSEKRPAFSSNRRTASSWNKGGNSSWNVGSKDNWRVRKRACASSAGAQDGDGDSSDDSGSSPRRYGEISGGKNSSPFSREPKVHVQKGKAVFEVEGSVVTEAHPDALYNIITDFGNTAKVYRTIDRVEIEDLGSEKIVKQFLHWSFLAWRGEYNVTLRMKPDPVTRTLSYNLDEPGFLKVFNGSWTVEPIPIEGKATLSKLIVQQEVLPSIIPPGPLAMGAGSYAARIMSGQVKNALIDLAKEAAAVNKAGEST